LERAGLIKELGKLVDLSPEEQVSVLTELGVTDELACRLLLSLLHLGLNPASFKTQLLPLLSLPNDLKVAVRQQGLKGSHALMLATLSAKALKTEEQKAASERMAATQTVLSEELNVAQTRELIGQIKLKYAPNTPVESKKMASFLKNLDKLIGQAEFRSASPQQLTQMRQKLTALLESLGS
jgi:ParB family chromosome partitioning protein